MMLSVDLKKLLSLLLVAFVVFFVFSQPAEAAQLVRQTGELAWSLVSRGADSLSTFVTQLIQ